MLPWAIVLEVWDNGLGWRRVIVNNPPNFFRMKLVCHIGTQQVSHILIFTIIVSRLALLGVVQQGLCGFLVSAAEH